jgi:hypothetical protein
MHQSRAAASHIVSSSRASEHLLLPLEELPSSIDESVLDTPGAQNAEEPEDEEVDEGEDERTVILKTNPALNVSVSSSSPPLVAPDEDPVSPVPAPVSAISDTPSKKYKVRVNNEIERVVVSSIPHIPFCV